MLKPHSLQKPSVVEYTGTYLGSEIRRRVAWRLILIQAVQRYASKTKIAHALIWSDGEQGKCINVLKLRAKTAAYTSRARLWYC